MKKPSKIGTKEHYWQVVMHMLKLMDKISEKSPESMSNLKELNFGLQIINNAYVLKAYPSFKDEKVK